MIFVIICVDHPQSASLRLATRPAHLAFLERDSRVMLGGPFLDEVGAMVGSMIVLKASSAEEAEAFAAADPYAQAGLFASCSIRPWRQTAGSARLGE